MHASLPHSSTFIDINQKPVAIDRRLAEERAAQYGERMRDTNLAAGERMNAIFRLPKSAFETDDLNQSFTEITSAEGIETFEKQVRIVDECAVLLSGGVNSIGLSEDLASIDLVVSVDAL
jgi:hypothetical protein